MKRCTVTRALLWAALFWLPGWRSAAVILATSDGVDDEAERQAGLRSRERATNRGRVRARIVGPLRLASVLALGLMLGACAFGDRSVTLGYPPAASAQASSGTAAAQPAPAARAIAIALLRFEDGRAITDRVGEVRNGFGMHTADVVAKNDVVDWVMAGIAEELRRQDYAPETITSAAAASPGLPVLSGIVLSAHSSAFLTYEADVSIHATLTRDGSTLLNEAIVGNDSGSLNLAATGASFGEALERALQKAAQKLAARLGTLDLGSP